MHLCGAWHSLTTFPPAQQSLPQKLTSLLALRSAPAEQQQPAQQQQRQKQAVTAAAAPQSTQQSPVQAAAPVCVDFGSMASLGLVANPSHLLRVLEAAAQQLGRPIILLAGASEPCRMPRGCAWLEQLFHLGAGQLPS